MADSILRGRLETYHIAFTYGITTQLVNEAVRRHDCDPAGAHLLGRAMTSAVLAAASLPQGERLNARWAYTGTLRTLVVDTGPDGATRAFLSPAQLSATEDVGTLYGGGGNVQVVRSRDGVVVASGTANADLQDVVDDLAYFLCISDQVESSAVVLIALSSDPANPVRLCRGVLVQAMPDCDLAMFGRIRDHLRDPQVRAFLARDDESDNLFESVLNLLVREEKLPPRLTFEVASTPFFRCACSREKMGAVLRSLPYTDRMDIARKKENVVVHCRFCNERYELTLDDCIRAWNEKPPATT